MSLFGMRLKTLRNSKNLTQEQLSEKLGITKSAVSRYEQSATYCSIDVLIKLCDFFGVSADYMLGLSDKIDIKLSHLTDLQVQMIVGMINELERLNGYEVPID